jgi:rifampicin phosphotransferase
VVSPIDARLTAHGARGKHLVSLEAASGLDAGQVGPKARNLGRMRRAGLPVPDGYVIVADAWRQFAAAEPLRGALEVLESTQAETDAARVRSLCGTAELPLGLAQDVESALACLHGESVAVRSAALAEDGEFQSAAGVFHTALSVVGSAAVLDQVRACWASQFSQAALSYQKERTGESWAMAVVVQVMVPAKVAGVLFSQAATGDVLIEAVEGMCRPLVDGQANPERYHLPDDLETVRHEALLTAPVLRELRDLALRAEEVVDAKTGVDLEWAATDERVFVLQARPITRSLGQSRKAVCWSAANSQEALLDPVTPLTWSLLSPLVEAGRRDMFRAAGFDEIHGHDYMRLFFGLPYFNPDYFRRFLRQIPGAPENIFDVLIFGESEREIEFRLPEFNARTIRMLGMFLFLRLAARERFEIFQRLFSLRLWGLRRRSLTGLSDAELLSLRRDATDLLEGALRRHVLGTAISGAAYLLLGMFLEQTGVTSQFERGLLQRLTSGASGNPVAEASQELEALARSAATGAEPKPEQLLELLDESGFLARHGHRCEKEAELLEPRWRDEPQVLLAVLQSYVRAAKSGDGLARLADRETSLRDRARGLAGRVSRVLVRGRLGERVLPIRRVLFRSLLREARRYAPYRETLKDRALRALHLVRQVFLEVGKRLTERGVLREIEDVFFLDLETVERALTMPAADVRREGLRERVALMRAERSRDLEGDAPSQVVVVPGQPPQPIHADASRGELMQGIGASSGKITGVARVLRSTDEAARLNPGEILVARVINAGWTPLFHLAGGIVAEVGGVLSHGAIVAREYGIPAVFGAQGASHITDGAIVTVDGDLGLVTLNDPLDL